MCGFFGVFGDKSSLNPEKEKLISRTLTHRGPDDFQTHTGKYSHVMFWRLSIVDQIGGKQPMVSENGKVVILFNGEIYNFKEIRKDLEVEGFRPRTNSDTEVLLLAYQKWGIAAFNRLEGMFAICLSDELKNRIILARDRLGVKPLYYQSTPSTLVIASEQKALLAFHSESPTLDHTGLTHYLLFQTVPAIRTLFKGISKVPPGTVLEFDLKQKNFLGAHKIIFSKKIPIYSHYEDYRQELRETILHQTRLALDTDLPICFHLSGGLDSNTLIALCRVLDPKRAFVTVTSLVEGEQDPEWPFIRQAAEYHRSPLKVANVTEESFFNILDDVVYYLDEPVGDPGIVAQFLVNRLASEESKIVYSGQGFDEMFFGYIRDLAVYLLAVHGRGIFDSSFPLTNDFLKGWESFLHSLSFTDVSPELALFKKLCRFNPFDQESSQGNLPEAFLSTLRSTASDIFLQLMESVSSLHDFILLAETTIQLPSLLHMEDRASMRYSLETRVPFCTSHILSLAAQSKLEWKFHEGKPKGILRDIFQDILPPPILTRKEKVGRPIPFRQWLKNIRWKIYRQEIEKKRELFADLTHFDFVTYALNHPNPYDRSAWAALSLSRWMDVYRVVV